MPKISKKFMVIWAPALTGLGLMIALSFMALYYSMKISDGSGLREGGIKASNGKEIFYKLGCVRCHNIRVLNINGGHVGPDLSGAYSDVKKVYKENVNSFLKNPAGTMYFVLMFNHLNKKDREIITAELKKAQIKENNIKIKNGKKRGWRHQ